MLSISERNPGTAIGDLDGRRRTHLDDDLGARRGVGYRVFDEISDRILDRMAIATDDDRLLRPLRGERAHFRRNFADARVQIRGRSCLLDDVLVPRMLP